MKASVCIEMIYTEYPFLDRIKIAAEQGFDAVEFWNWDNKDLPADTGTAEEAGVEGEGLVAINPQGCEDAPAIQKSCLPGREADLLHRNEAVIVMDELV